MSDAGRDRRTPVDTPRPRAPGERLYRALLCAYPRAFRDRYGDAMADFYRDRRRDARRVRGGVARLWLRAVADVALTAPRERLAALIDRAPAHPTPDYARPGDSMFTMFLQDLRYAVRGMLARPSFTAIVVATLALGIGANVAIFSVVNGVLVRALPYREPERIAHFSHQNPYSQVSEPEFMDYKREMTTIAQLAAMAGTEVNIVGDDEPQKVEASRVSDGFFQILGVAPIKGRYFAPDEDRPNGPSVVVISHALWRSAFGGDTNIIGKTLALNGGVPRTVIGVMPAGFDYPATTTALWIPLRLNPDSLWTRNNHYLQLIARIAPTATVEQAAAQASTLARVWGRDFPETYLKGESPVPVLTPIREEFVANSRPYLFALVGAVGFVLLVACVNVANLLLARGETRRRELAIRTALGASGRRLMAQMLTESGLMALVGGALGVAIAVVAVRALIVVAPDAIPRLNEIRIDGVVLAFALFISLATGLVFGLLPAARAAGGNSASSLKDGGKTSSHHGAMRHARRALVVAEVALAVVMLMGSGLLLRSLWKLQGIDLGFDPANALTLRVSLPPRAYSPEKTVQFFIDLNSRLRAAPGVTHVAAMGSAPVTGGGCFCSIMVDGRELKTIGEAPAAQLQQVTPEFFATMAIALKSGHGFSDADRIGSPYVAVVNETMAKQLWPGQNPLGRTVKMFNPTAPWMTVVGVARDVQSPVAKQNVQPTLFMPHAQSQMSAYYAPTTMTVVVRTAGDPDALAGVARRAVRDLERAAPVADVQTLEHLVGTSIAGRRFSTLLLAGFAGLALFLAGLGIYGVVSYGVSQRTYEIGLRMALGAEQNTVMRLVVNEGLRMTLVGLAIGLVGGLAVTRFLTSLLVDTSVVDVPTLAAVSVVLALVAVVASVVPARRAMAVSPTEALRGG